MFVKKIINNIEDLVIILTKHCINKEHQINIREHCTIIHDFLKGK